MHVGKVALGAILLLASGSLLHEPAAAGVRAPFAVAAVASLCLVGWSVLLGTARRKTG